MKNSQTYSTKQKDKQMSEENNTLEAQSQELREQAIQADEQGLTVDELQPSSDTTGDNATPAKGEEQDTNDDNNNDDIDSNSKPNTNVEGKDNDNSNQDIDTANSSKKAPSKEEKEEARKEKSWRKLEEEKAKFLREKAEFEASKLNNAPKQAPSENSQGNNTLKTMLDSYNKLAKEFEDNGEFDKAQEARKYVQQIQDSINSQNQNQNQTSQAQNPTNQQQFKVAWSANIERAINDFPEMKDPKSEFGKNVKAVLADNSVGKYLGSRPDGVYIAAQLSAMKMKAVSVDGLKKENATLKSEIKKLRQGMGLPDTGASNRAGETKSFESLSLAEQSKILRKRAEEEDGYPSSGKTFI